MRHMRRLTVSDERGAIFLSGLVLVMIMTILGVSLFSLSRIEGDLATSDIISSRLLYCAEAGLSRTMNDLTFGGRVNQISNQGFTPNTALTFNEVIPYPLTPGLIMCSNTITFTNPANAGCAGPGGRCWYLTATSVDPRSLIRRVVRVQLLNSWWQNWASTSVNENGAPFWDGNSSDFNPAVGNIGSWLSNTGAFTNGAGPGVRYPFYGDRANLYNSGSDTGGTPLPDIFFRGTGGNVTVTFEAEFTAYNGQSGAPFDTFGWFDSTAGGTVGTLHPIFVATNYTPNSATTLITAKSGFSVTPPPFTPSTGYYGFYLTNGKGETMFSLSSKQTGIAVPGVQHLAFFRQDANTYWIGTEDLNSSPDRDFQDMIFKLVVASGDTLIPPSGVPPLSWKDWQECPLGAGQPPCS